MVEVSFDHYHGYDETTEILHEFAEEYPGLTELYSIGKSTEGRDLWLINITNKETGSPRRSPQSTLTATPTRQRLLGGRSASGFRVSLTGLEAYMFNALTLHRQGPGVQCRRALGNVLCLWVGAGRPIAGA